LNPLIGRDGQAASHDCRETEIDQIGRPHIADHRKQVVRGEEHRAEADRRQQEIERVRREDTEVSEERAASAVPQGLGDDEEDRGTGRQAEDDLGGHEEEPGMPGHDKSRNSVRSER
jgi:hypothetical protein